MIYSIQEISIQEFFMYKWLASFFTFSLCLCTLAFADSSQAGQGQKIYFQQKNVVLQNNQILIGNGNKWAPVSRLSADENGLFITVPQDSVGLFKWECERCGWENWFWEDRCEACDRRR
jgi:hypothetical protein